MKNQLVKWLLGIIILLSLGIISCKKDNNDNGGKSSELIGKWIGYRAALDDDEDGIRDEEENVDIPVGAAFDLTFKSDGSGNLYEKGEDGEESIEVFTWKLNDAKTIINLTNEDGELIEIDVITLTSSKLTIGLDDEGYSWFDFNKE